MEVKENLKHTGPEQGSVSAELKLPSYATDVLRGTTIPALKDGKRISVVLEGSGQFGLTNWEDNKKWTGIFHHSILTGRIASYFSQKLQEQGHDTNPQRLIDAMTFSHAGRRASEDARDYPETVDRYNGSGASQAKKSVTNEVLGLRIIKGKLPPTAQDEFELVAALAHENEEFPVAKEVYDSLDFRISIYVDHRTTDRYMPLNQRLGDFLIANFFDGGQVSDDKKIEIHQTMQEIIDRRKEDVTNGIAFEESLQYAKELAEKLGANNTSPRLKDRSHLLTLLLNDAETEILLQQAGIDTENINNTTVPMPKWEDDVRKEYVSAARSEIFARIDEIVKPPEDGKIDVEKINKETGREFPPDKWWTRYVIQLNREYRTKIREQMNQRSGVPAA